MKTFSSSVILLLALICFITPIAFADKAPSAPPKSTLQGYGISDNDNDKDYDNDHHMNNDKDKDNDSDYDNDNDHHMNSDKDKDNDSDYDNHNDNDNDNDNHNDNDNDNDNHNDNDNEMDETPVSQLTTVAIDIHFISGDIDNQFIVYHYCSPKSTGFLQCILYDGNEKDSRVIGIEEVISADIFAKLSDVEKHLYHSHSYAIKNGIFAIPGLATKDENPVLQSIIDTYGKVTDVWDQNSNLPRGAPRLAFGIVKAGQLNAKVAAEFDKLVNDGLTYKQRAANRKSLKAMTVLNGANNYLTSHKGIQYGQYSFNVDGYGDRT